MEKTKTTRALTLLTIILLSFSAYLSMNTSALSIKETSPQPSNTPSGGSTLLFQHQDYESIQQAINSAPSGATILLPAGLYTEILLINKPLHLKGSSASETKIITSSLQNGHAISITAEGVILSNLTVQNKGPGLYATAIKITADNTTIQDCILSHTPIGIALWSSHNTITNCYFEGCDDEAIVLLGSPENPCSHNKITNCTFVGNCDGIELQHASYNTIAHCRFLSNTHAGIDMIESSNNHNLIISCEFDKNKGFGIYMASSSDNQIIQCSFHADSLLLVRSPNNILKQSTITNIRLIDESSLLIQECSNITSSMIRTQHSYYEISQQQQPKIQQRNPISRLPLLSLFLGRIAALRAGL